VGSQEFSHHAVSDHDLQRSSKTGEPEATALVAIYNIQFGARMRKLWPPKVGEVSFFEKTFTHGCPNTMYFTPYEQTFTILCKTPFIPSTTQ
jgi:hypothetical protein